MVIIKSYLVMNGKFQNLMKLDYYGQIMNVISCIIKLKTVKIIQMLELNQKLFNDILFRQPIVKWVK